MWYFVQNNSTVLKILRYFGRKFVGLLKSYFIGVGSLAVVCTIG